METKKEEKQNKSDYFARLTLAVYRLTDLMPDKEPIGFLIRQKALEAFANAILLQEAKNLGLGKEREKGILENFCLDVAVLNGYFAIAKDQDWVRQENFLFLEKEYESAKKYWVSAAQDNENKKEEMPVVRLQATKPSLAGWAQKPMAGPKPVLENKRHRIILGVLGKKDEAQVRDIKLLLPQVSKRTLRRDFDWLLKKGLVERKGNGNATVYKLKMSVRT